MPASPLECLPTELLISITDHLPSGHSILLLRHVSKTLHDILSSHDVVSHALVHHYPHSQESQLPLHHRTKAVFDAVVRRSYTQPRRRNPRKTTRLTCYPIFCSEEDQVLAYQTSTQSNATGWACTLWDLEEDKEVVVELHGWEVGGCYNEHGELFGSAVLRDIWCTAGRGVMVVGGRHKHVVGTNWNDLTRGEFEDGKVELGYYGVHVAPRSRHEHTFLHIYSLSSPTLGALLSSFSFYGSTHLTHKAANTHFFASLSEGSMFIYTLPSTPPPAASLHTLLAAHTSKPPAIWRDYTYSASTTAITPDSQGNYIFIYSDPGIGGFYDRGHGSVSVISAIDGSTLKKVTLSDSRAHFEYRLERDDSRLWDWRFERTINYACRCRPASPTPGTPKDEIEEGEEVSLTWVGSYGVFGTRGHRIGVEGLDEHGCFTGERTPVMIEWRITTFAAAVSDGLVGRERVAPTLYYAPSEHAGGAGVMGVEDLTGSYEDVESMHGLVRWPVAVSPYVYTPPAKKRMLRWGIGRGFLTSGGEEYRVDEGTAVTLWYERVGDGVQVRWKSVLRADRVDGGFFYEGCGWVLYRVRDRRRDWRREERIEGGVRVVEYDDEDDMDMEEEEGDGERLVFLRF